MTIDPNSKQAHLVYTALLGLLNVLTLLNTTDTWVVLVPHLDATAAAGLVAVFSTLLAQGVQRVRDAEKVSPSTAQPTEVGSEDKPSAAPQPSVAGAVPGSTPLAH